MAPGERLANLRLGFACTQRWEDMVGDDRVRACAGCNRQVFNLSGMTRAEAEALLAARGETPCVRFYRRPDGSVMTTDCPTSARPVRRRLAVVAAGTALAAAPAAMADPATAETTEQASGSGSDATAPKVLTDDDMEMGVPVTDEVGIILMLDERPAVEWSVWGRAGVGVAPERSEVSARRLTAPDPATGSTSEAAALADLTVGVARQGDLRVGAWGEVRTTSDPVAGAELVLEGLPPHPYDSRIGGTGSLVVRAGANERVVTGALGFGYIGAFPRSDPWIRWARHVVGARVVVSVNRAIDDAHDWSATLGLEVEPIGAAHALLDLVTGR